MRDRSYLTNASITDLPASNLRETYAVLRAQVEHENELYNQRLIWLITIQALLFATIGLILQAIIPYEKKSELGAIFVFIALICFLGMLVALIARRLLLNATHCVEEIGRYWDHYASRAACENGVAGVFPHVRGGVGMSRHNILLRSGNLPYVFVIAWIGTLLVLLKGVTRYW